MKAFLDTCVLLSACGSSKGVSRYAVENADPKGWELFTSLCCREETLKNLGKLGSDVENCFSGRIEGGINWKNYGTA